MPVEVGDRYDALRLLASLPDTTAAVISGRALRDLAVMSRLPSEVHLIGSHGSEFDTGFVHALDEQKRALHAGLVSTLDKITRNAPGVLLEIKPASVAVHVRQAEPFGDDLSAEEVFIRLAGPDLGIKVGGGATIASYRVGDSTAVAQVLAGWRWGGRRQGGRQRRRRPPRCRACRR